MNYTIKQVSDLTGLPTTTLRYYEKERLLPEVARSASGIRVYTDSDLEWLSIINCLKNTNMPIKQIREFVELCASGDSTLWERRKIVLDHKKAVEEQIAALKEYLEHINFKAQYYQVACEAGTEEAAKKKFCKKDKIA